MQVPPAFAKTVVDWNHRPVGHVAREQRDPRTKTVRSLVIHLTGEAQRALHAEHRELVIPVQFVFGVRRDEVTLDRPLETLRQAAEAPARTP